MPGALLAVPFAFLVGSVPTGVLVSRALGAGDVRRHGSGNIGAANVARTAGFRAGVLVAIIDVLKGVVPVLVVRSLGLDDAVLAAIAVAAVLGHDYSVFLNFRGGKGVATTLGAALALAPLAAVVTMLVWLLVLFAFRYSSLASLVALVVLPISLVLTHQPREFVVAAALLALVGLWTHRENITRLATGTESRFGRRKNADDS